MLFPDKINIQVLDKCFEYDADPNTHKGAMFFNEIMNAQVGKRVRMAGSPVFCEEGIWTFVYQNEDISGESKCIVLIDLYNTSINNLMLITSDGVAYVDYTHFIVIAKRHPSLLERRQALDVLKNLFKLTKQYENSASFDFFKLWAKQFLTVCSEVGLDIQQ